MCSYNKVGFIPHCKQQTLSVSLDHGVKILAVSAVTQARICPWQVVINQTSHD